MWLDTVERRLVDELGPAAVAPGNVIHDPERWAAKKVEHSFANRWQDMRTVDHVVN